MGFGQLEVEFLLHEHRYQPFVGEALSIGRQAVAMKPEAMLNLLKAYGIEPKNTSFKVDTKNRHNLPGSGWIDDESFFASFSECKLFSADISDYEGADFIFDICGEVPPELVGRFDFLMDGGSLDNVWDPAQMLRNMTKMLKPGGRIFVYAWSNSYPSAYLKITPDWIMDYFAANEFADAKVYMAHHPSRARGETSLAMWYFEPITRPSLGSGFRRMIKTALRPDIPGEVEDEGRFQVFSMAEKGDASTDNRMPIQWQYRLDSEPYVKSRKAFKRSDRPIFNSPTGYGGPLSDLPPIGSWGSLKPVARWG